MSSNEKQNALNTFGAIDLVLSDNELVGGIGDRDRAVAALVLPLVLADVLQVAVTAIQKWLQSFFASSRIPLLSFASRSGAEGEARMRPPYDYCNLIWETEFTVR